MEIKLDVDKNGKAVINLRYFDKRDCLEDKLLKSFVERARKGCLQLRGINGYIESGKPDSSWEQLQIEVCE